ncbi:hypothetical protein NPIL_201181 [Nephila pilipes]|uniref:Uncharacterized protein n=1 Tax=Nephila pilipes TaxID=299642 RepID=A0A8X6NG09_NEPPI|nr:hypothetical protein NPIL_201181 [Nephila pilipes]
MKGKSSHKEARNYKFLKREKEHLQHQIGRKLSSYHPYYFNFLNPLSTLYSRTRLLTFSGKKCVKNLCKSDGKKRSFKVLEKSGRVKRCSNLLQVKIRVSRFFRIICGFLFMFGVD